MSFPFRKKPSLRERFKDKTGEEILNEMREEINQDRKHFFNNTNWGWDSSPPTSSFPRRFNLDDEELRPSRLKLNSELDRIAERHPDLAEELRDWRRKGRTDFEKGRDLRGGSGSSSVLSEGSVAGDMEGGGMGERMEEGCGPQRREPVVRHIPIFVEDRGEVILPKEALIEEAGEREAGGGGGGIPGGEGRAGSGLREEVRSGGGHKEPTPPTQQFQPSGSSVSQQPIPAPAPPAPKRCASPVPCSPSPPPQQVPPTPKADPALEAIAKIESDVQTLEEKVKFFKGGPKTDKDYVYLDEMLTRNLLKLDDVETEGREEVRASRRNAVRSIQRCISLLDSKATKTEEKATTGGNPNESSSKEVSNQNPLQLNEQEKECDSVSVNTDSRNSTEPTTVPSSSNLNLVSS